MGRGSSSEGKLERGGRGEATAVGAEIQPSPSAPWQWEGAAVGTRVAGKEEDGVGARKRGKGACEVDDGCACVYVSYVHKTK